MVSQVKERAYKMSTIEANKKAHFLNAITTAAFDALEEMGLTRADASALIEDVCFFGVQTTSAIKRGCEAYGQKLDLMGGEPKPSQVDFSERN